MSDNALLRRRDDIDRVLGANQWERFIAQARGFGHMLGNALTSVPQSFNRLLQYKPGTEDPDEPVDAFNLAGMAMFAPMGTIPRGALSAGFRNPAISQLNVNDVVRRLSTGESRRAIAAELRVSERSLQRVVERDRPDVAPELFTRTPTPPREAKIIGRHEQQVRFNEMMASGETDLGRIAEYTRMKPDRIRELMSQRYGERAIMDDAF